MIEYLLEDRSKLYSPMVFFLAGIVYTFISAVLAIVLFPSSASTSHVLLTTVAAAPILFRAVIVGAHILDKHPHEVVTVQSWFWFIYFAYLMGAILGFQLSYFVVPEPLRSIIVQDQMRELSAIEGVKVELSGMATSPSPFWLILSNNLRVYILSIVLSFLYGTGGVLLLNWNASIIAALFTKEFMEKNPLQAFLSFLGILPHGIFEFLGYFTGGITGIFIGVAIVQERWNRRLLRDVLLFFLLGIAFIVVGAAIESGFL